MTTETAIAESTQAAQTATPAPETVQTAQDTPQAEASTQQTEPTESEKIKAAYEKRISRITAARHAEARRAEEYAKQLKALQAPKESEGAPKEADFATVEEYHEAKGKWKAEQEFSKKQAEEREQQQRQTLEAENRKWVESVQAKEAEFRKTFPDYDDAAAVVNEAVSLVQDRGHPSFLAFADAMRSSDDTLALTRYLGQNPDELESMFKMNPAQIYRTIARIEAKLATPPETEEVKQVSAPPKPIGGTGRVAKPLSQMTASELVKWSRK